MGTGEKKPVKRRGTKEGVLHNRHTSTTTAPTAAPNTQETAVEPWTTESEAETTIATTTESTGNTTRTVILWSKGRLGDDTCITQEDAAAAKSYHARMAHHARGLVQTGNGKKRGVSVNLNGACQVAHVSDETEALAPHSPAKTDTEAAFALPTTACSNPSTTSNQFALAIKTNIPAEKEGTGSEQSSIEAPNNKISSRAESEDMIATIDRADAQIREAFNAANKQGVRVVGSSVQRAIDLVEKRGNNRPAPDLSIEEGGLTPTGRSGRSSGDKTQSPEAAADRPRDGLKSNAAHSQRPADLQVPQTISSQAAELSSTNGGTWGTLRSTKTMLPVAFPALSTGIAHPENGAGAPTAKRQKLDTLSTDTCALRKGFIATSTAPKSFLATPNAMSYDGASESIPIPRVSSVDQQTKLPSRPGQGISVPEWNSFVVEKETLPRSTADLATRAAHASSDSQLTTQLERRRSTASSQAHLAAAPGDKAPASANTIPQDLEDYIPHLKNVTRCGNCGRTPARYLVCLRCLETRYCGKYCQIWDWQLHRRLCSRSILANDEGVIKQEEWLEEYWAGAVEMLLQNVVDTDEPVGIDEAATMHGHLESKSEDEHDVNMGNVAQDRRGGEPDLSRDSKLYSDEQDDQDAGKSSDSEEDAKAPGAEGDEDQVERASVRRRSSSPPSMFWSRAMSLHLARGGKFELGSRLFAKLE